jgi:hypothetical protein
VVIPGSVWRECWSEEELRRINRLRFALTRVLKEFNRRDPRFVAFLKLSFDKSRVCGREEGVRDVIYMVKVKRRGDTDDGFVSMGFYYAVDRDIRDVMIFGNYDCVFDLGETLDLLSLFLRLAVTFHTA